MTLTVANILTLLRLVLVPFFVASFVMGFWPWSLVFFSVAAFTDMIDGTVARLLKQPSKGGAVLDPMADKLLVQSCFLCLAVAGILPWWFFALSLLRDLTIVSGIFYLEYIHAELPYRPTWTSKFTTLFELTIAVLGIIIWKHAFASIGGLYLAEWLFGAVVVASILITASGIQYVHMGFGILRQHRDSGARAFQ